MAGTQQLLVRRETSMGAALEVTLGVQIGVSTWASPDSSQWLGCRPPIVYLSAPVRFSMYPIDQQKCGSFAGSFC